MRPFLIALALIGLLTTNAEAGRRRCRRGRCYTSQPGDPPAKCRHGKPLGKRCEQCGFMLTAYQPDQGPPPADPNLDGRTHVYAGGVEVHAPPGSYVWVGGPRPVYRPYARGYLLPWRRRMAAGIAPRPIGCYRPAPVAPAPPPPPPVYVPPPPPPPQPPTVIVQ
jgi:hypothetical protein